MLRQTFLGAATALTIAGAAVAQTGGTDPARAASEAESPRVLMQQEGSQRMTGELIGLGVFNPQGETVGKISHLVIEPDRRVSGVVLSVGGFLGLGSKAVAVPWEAIQFENKGGKDLAIVNLTNEELTNAPEFKTLAQQQSEREAAQIQEQQRTRQPARTPQ